MFSTSRDGDPYAAYRLVGNAFAAVILAASVAEFVFNCRHPTDRDFLEFWGAARLALSGNPSAAYDNAALHAVQSAAATFGSRSAELPFPYPPAYLLLLLPFAVLSFPVAMVAWSLSTFAFYLFAARRLFPRSGWLAAAFPAVFANAAIGQNGFLTAGLFMSGLSLLSLFPFAAGLVLGCLVIKPQLAMLLPVALIAGRHWRAIGGAAVSATAVMVVGLLLFGGASTVAWLDQAPLIVRVTGEGLMGWSKLASIYAAAREMGIPAGAAIALHTFVAAIAAAAVWRIWRSPGDEGARVAILAAGSMLISPYLFFYDGLLLVPAFFYLAQVNERAGVLIALWCVPLLVMAQIGASGELVNLNPVVPILLLALTYHRWSADRADRELQASALTFAQPCDVRLSQRVEQ